MVTLRFDDGNGEHDQWTSMLPLLALGSLSAEEKNGVDRHLASDCSRCPDVLRIYQAVAAALAGVFPAINPSALGTRRVKRVVRLAATSS